MKQALITVIGFWFK